MFEIDRTRSKDASNDFINLIRGIIVDCGKGRIFTKNIVTGNVVQINTTIL